MIPTHSLTQKRYGTTIVSLRDGNILFLEDKLESQFCDWVILRGEIQISAGQRCLKAGIVGAPSLSNKSMKQLFLLITWVCSGKRLTSPQDAAILAVYRSNLWRGNSPLRHGAHGNKFEATVRAATFFQPEISVIPLDVAQALNYLHLKKTFPDYPPWHQQWQCVAMATRKSMARESFWLRRCQIQGTEDVDWSWLFCLQRSRSK